MEILLAQDRAIWRMQATGETRKLVANATGASGVDYLYSRNMMFWSDVKTRKVYSQSLMGSSMSLDVDISLPGLYSIKLFIKSTYSQKKKNNNN